MVNVKFSATDKVFISKGRHLGKAGVIVGYTILKNKIFYDVLLHPDNFKYSGENHKIITSIEEECLNLIVGDISVSPDSKLAKYFNDYPVCERKIIMEES